MDETLKTVIVYVKWVLLISGTACLISGCATDRWQANQSTHEGLWKTCRERTGCSSVKFEGSEGMLFY